MISGSLATGYSLPQSLDALVKDGSPPVAEEVGRALAEARLGAPIEDCLDKVAHRMASEDFRWTVMAIRIQRNVGGNLAEVLATTASTMRERARLRRQVHVLSAEGRLSANILIAMPICMVIYMLLVRRDYLEPLYTTGMGFLMIGAAVTFVTLGAVMIRKLVKVEV